MAFNPVSIIFIWGELVKRLMRADVIIGLIPSLELLVVLVQPDRDIPNFLELLSMGPVRLFDTTVELGGMGRQNKETDFPFLTGFFKVPFKL